MNKRIVTSALCLSFCLSMMPLSALGADEQLQESTAAAVVTQAEEPEAEISTGTEESRVEEVPLPEPETPSVEETTEPAVGEEVVISTPEPVTDPEQQVVAVPDTSNEETAQEADGLTSSGAEVVQASGVGTGSTCVGAYTDSPYYESLQNVILIGDQRRDIVNIALSQVGYCESDSAYDLTGTNAGRSNYTEYGRYTGRQGQAWCASFISWCAYQAGVSTSVIPVTAGANVGSFGTALRYNSSAVQPGDIICFNGGTHVGIVYAKDSEYLYTVEGNYSNQVIALRYALNDSSLTYYYSPNYASVWDVQEGSWYCYDDETEGWQTGWMTIGSSLFYLDPDNDGAAVTGWAEIDGEYYYFAGEPGIMQTGWVQVDGTWYYLGTDGIRQTGWLVLSTGTFYLDPETGAMCTGWQKLGEKWYYFDSNGYEKTGWFYDGCWYYLDPKRAGAMSTGWKTVDGDRYYFNGSGQMMTGWVLIDENWYYFESSGRMVTGEYEIDGTNWFFDKNGVWQEFISQDPELI